MNILDRRAKALAGNALGTLAMIGSKCIATNEWG
jgi:hypothetical protein